MKYTQGCTVLSWSCPFSPFQWPRGPQTSVCQSSYQRPLQACRYFAPNASGYPCLNHVLLTFLWSEHDRSHQSFPSSSVSSIRFFTFSFVHPFSVFSSIIIIIASIPDFTCFCLRVFSFQLLPTRTMSLGNLLLYFSHLTLLIIRELQGLPRTGNRESLFLLEIIADTLRDCYRITYQSKHCFCLPSLSWMYSWMVFCVSLIFITFSLSVVIASR